jgi:GTPase SAR1 family protein
VKKGTARLLQYLKEMQAPTKPWNRIKLIVVGQENVGKTHLVRRLQKKEYPKNISTDGIEVQSWATSKKVEFRVYDFGGQEVRCSSPPTYNTLNQAHKQASKQTANGATVLTDVIPCFFLYL